MNAFKIALAAAAVALGAGSAFAAPSEPTVFGHRIEATRQAPNRTAVQEGRSAAEPRLLGPASEPTVFGHRLAPTATMTPFPNRLDH